MTNKRTQPKPASRGVDLAFKFGLPLLIAAALVITFLPESRNASSPSVVDGGAFATNGIAPLAAPAAPVPAPADGGFEGPIPGRIIERADALLIEKMLQSDSVADLNQFGNALLTRGELTNAARVFRRAIELDGESEINHFNLGLTFARLQQTNEAIAEYRTALEIFPDYAEAHNSLGLQLMAQGKFEDAEKHYRTAVELQPDFATAQNNLGTVLARQRRYPDALVCFEKAVSLDTNYVAARYNLANALVQVGRKDEAIGRLQDLINQFPDHRPAQRTLERLMSAEPPKP